MSVVIHEVSHGYAADLQGDPTARLAGRLTLNPISHLDLFGSIIVPILGYLTIGIPFGWAKPVPFNPYNVRNQRWGEAIIAFAGPLSNLVLATFFGLLIRNAGSLHLSQAFLDLSMYVVLINIGLACFNLIPIPPLDGSKILFSILPFNFSGRVREIFESYGLFLMIFVIYFGGSWIRPFVIFLFKLLTGINF